MAKMDPVEDDEEQEMDLEEDEPAKQVSASQVHSAEKSEEMKWDDLELDQKCKNVMSLLAHEERRWDDSSGNPNVPILEEYKKSSLTMRDLRDKTHPTVLHILARHYKRDYSNVPEHIRKTVIRYLLEHREKSSSETRLEENVQEQPILNVAMTFENDEFIDCVMDCWPHGFSDLLDIQDSEGKNCLHHIFILPTLTEKLVVKEIQVAKAKTLERGLKFVPKAKAETLAAKDKDGNTPIHYAMDYRQCFGRTRKYVEMFQEMVLKGDKAMEANGAFNNNDESPILYCQRTRTEYKAWQHARQQQNQPSQTTPDTQKRADNVKEPKPQSSAQAPEDDGETAKATASAGAQSTKPLPHDRSDKFPPIKGALDRSKDAPDGFGLRRSSTSAHPGSPALSTKPNATPPNEHRAHSQMPPPAARPAAKLPSAGGEQGQNRRDGEKPVNDILEFLRLHYIRTRSDLEARDLMEGKDASDKNLYFDASGHKGADKIIELIDRLSVGGFGSTLSYVYLPTVLHSQDNESAAKPTKKSYPMNQGMARQRGRVENPKTGRTSLISVFNRLHEVGVRNILRLLVEDRDPPSHTDAAIEMALQGRDSLSESQASRPISVETWDWRKPDLSTDVIAFAAPTVEQVNLYWSGNQTVLRGWGCPEGIPRLYATGNQKLKTVTVYAAPGIEERVRMDRMLDRFKTEIKNHTDGKVDVKIIYRMTGLFTKLDSNEETSDSAGSKAEGEQQHIWVKRMEEFRAALYSIHTALPGMGIGMPEKVKVALIDDGVDLSKLDTYYDTIVQATGLSYYPPDGKSERPWHRSSGGHGTIMANMIVRINPWVYLFVMKLQDGPSGDGGRTIFAESAAKAIWGAIRRNVDIISMSWTVKQKIASLTASTGSMGAANPAGNDTKSTFEMSAIKMLEDAIDAAVEAKILMFCSASDDIQAGGMDSLPYRKAPKYIFRIGAALALGQRDPHSEDTKNIDYFFPGNQVAEAWNPRSAETVKYHDGSSVSTALAAGLASLIIYCTIIMRTYHKAKTRSQNPQTYNRFKEFVEALKDRDKMKRAFDNIESGRWEDKKYLPVWDVFGPATEKIIDATEADKKLQHLEELVMDLCSKLTRL